MPKPSSYRSWGEEQHFEFVVLPQSKIDNAMLDSTYLSRKSREEQQQTPRKLLFYKSTEINVTQGWREAAFLPTLPTQTPIVYQNVHQSVHKN